MADLNEELNSVTASDCSFVILGNEPQALELDNENQNKSFHQMLTDSSMRSMKSMESTLAALNHKVTSDNEKPSDIQMQLDQLVKDNLLLKETLYQSNLAMKNQYCTLSLWYDEVVKTYESHKQRFLESQDQISELQLENAKLRKIIENMELETSCSGNCSLVMVNADNEGIDLLKRKVQSTEEILKNVSRTNEELSFRNNELKKNLNSMIEEQLNLEKKLEEVSMENDQLRKIAEAGRDVCNKCECSLVSKNGSEKSDCTSGIDPDKSVINRLPKNIGAELIGNEMKDEIAMLKKQLTEQQYIAQGHRVEMEKMKIEYEELLKDKDALQNVLKKCRTGMEQWKEQVKVLTVQVKLKEDLLESKTQELQKTKKEMEKFVLDCEEVAILRTQMELYQNDFNEERNAREKAVGEREQMAEEVRLLKRMMKDVMKKGNKAEKSAPSRDTIDLEVKNPYVCSICSKRFGTSPEWESHVDECLTFNAFP